MLYKAKNGSVKLPDGEMEYISFGYGERVLIMLPGLGDALRSVKGTALPMAFMYRMFAKDFKVWMFSRKSPLAPGCTTEDMARDLLCAMNELKISRACLFGVSMGGMIAQHAAAQAPERFEKLLLCVTSARENPILREAVGEWMACAERGDHRGLMESNLRRIYTESYCRKNGWLIPLVSAFTKPRSYERFLLMARACLSHDAYGRLSEIKIPTLVVGGELDLSLGGDASREIAAGIEGSELYMYADYGHGLYEEAKDFNSRVYDFFIGA